MNNSSNGNKFVLHWSQKEKKIQDSFMSPWLLVGQNWSLRTIVRVLCKRLLSGSDSYYPAQRSYLVKLKGRTSSLLLPRDKFGKSQSTAHYWSTLLQKMARVSVCVSIPTLYHDSITWRHESSDSDRTSHHRQFIHQEKTSPFCQGRCHDRLEPASPCNSQNMRHVVQI